MRIGVWLSSLSLLASLAAQDLPVPEGASVGPPLPEAKLEDQCNVEGTVVNAKNQGSRRGSARPVDKNGRSSGGAVRHDDGCLGQVQTERLPRASTRRWPPETVSCARFLAPGRSLRAWRWLPNRPCRTSLWRFRRPPSSPAGGGRTGRATAEREDPAVPVCRGAG